MPLEAIDDIAYVFNISHITIECAGPAKLFKKIATNGPDNAGQVKIYTNFPPSASGVK